MMLSLQIEGYSGHALATLIEMLGRIKIARANAVLPRIRPCVRDQCSAKE
jgi:hypothetical protein